MVKNGSRERWVAAGLCVDCGGGRAVNARTGKARSRCERCLERCRVAARAYRGRRTEEERQAQLRKMRERHRGRRAGRLAAGRCVRCGGARTAGSRFLTCAGCLQKLRQWSGQKRWNYGPEDAPVCARAMSLGRNVPPMTDGKTVVIWLPRHQAEMLDGCRRKFREREQAAGQAWRTHALSATVRDIVAGFRSKACPQPPTRGLRLMAETVRLYLDGPTRAIITEQANRSFDGNFSRCLRAMIQETACPKLKAQVVRMRAYDAWRDDP